MIKTVLIKEKKNRQYTERVDDEVIKKLGCD